MARGGDGDEGMEQLLFGDPQTGDCRLAAGGLGVS